jgi:hypothetical protein
MDELVTLGKAKSLYPFVTTDWFIRECGERYGEYGGILVAPGTNEGALWSRHLQEAVERDFPKQLRRMRTQETNQRMRPEQILALEEYLGLSSYGLEHMLRVMKVELGDWVYYVKNVRTGLIKIGRAKHIHRRVEQLRCATDDQLVLLAYEPEYGTVEQERHRQFKEDRSYREWFRPSAELVNHVQRCIDRGES